MRSCQTGPTHSAACRAAFVEAYAGADGSVGLDPVILRAVGRAARALVAALEKLLGFPLAA